MKYIGKNETEDVYETFIERDVEIPIDCEMIMYRGTNDTDDPSEVHIEGVKVAEDSGPYKKGQAIELTDIEEETISDRYWILNK